MEFSPGGLEKSLQSGAWVPTWADFSGGEKPESGSPLLLCGIFCAKGSSKEIGEFREMSPLQRYRQDNRGADSLSGPVRPQ